MYLKEPQTNQTVSLFNPRQNAWKEHFEWSDDYLHVIGKISIGRATVTTLKLNRSSVVNLRTALIAVEVHPSEHSL